MSAVTPYPPAYYEAEQKALSRYGSFMMDAGGHDLYLQLGQAAEAEAQPWSEDTAHLMNLGIDAALAAFDHPHYPWAASLVDFLYRALWDYGPTTRQAAVTFIKAATAYHNAFER
ncbi:MAG: hypothetical protein HRF48_02230 [Chloroflexota bacterium]|jgi:hypothetical protein